KLSFSKSIPSSPGGILGLNWVPWVAVLAGVALNSTPSLSRCYRTRRALSSFLRFSFYETPQVAGSRTGSNRRGEPSEGVKPWQVIYNRWFNCGLRRPLLPPCYPWRLGRVSFWTWIRSEEHTSELQSR